ncbi:MAG: biotin/lipoyl-containing protein, partial [Pseudonocardiaceae bacterium]
VHTRWIETEFTAQLAPYQGTQDSLPASERQTVVVEVGGRRLEVSLPSDFALSGGGAARAEPRKRGGGTAIVTSGNVVLAPMQGTVARVAVSNGDAVNTGDLLVVVEAMKMENPVHAHQAGTVTGLIVQAGTSVIQGNAICEIVPNC